MARATKLYLLAVGALMLITAVSPFLLRLDNVIAFLPWVGALSVLGNGNPLAVNNALKNQILSALLVLVFATVYYALLLCPSWAGLKQMLDRPQHGKKHRVIPLMLIQLALVIVHIALTIRIHDWIDRID